MSPSLFLQLMEEGNSLYKGQPQSMHGTPGSPCLLSAPRFQYVDRSSSSKAWFELCVNPEKKKPTLSLSSLLWFIKHRVVVVATVLV